MSCRQSLRRRPECLRGGCLRPVPQGRQCLRLGTPLVQAEVADGSVTASKIAKNSVGIWQLNPILMKYPKPEITCTATGSERFMRDSNSSFSVTAEGKYLTYHWKKDGVQRTGETNATLNDHRCQCHPA